MEILKSSDSPRVLAEKVKKNIALSEKGYKYHFEVKPPANPDEKTLWIDLFVKTITKEINTRTYADEYFASHPSIDKANFKYIGDDGKPTLEFKKMLYGDDYDPLDKYILVPKNNTLGGFCKPIESQRGIDRYDLDGIIFNTTDVRSLYAAFNTYGHLEYLNTSAWNTSKITNMDSTFNNCFKLQSIDISSWDTSKVTNMAYAFNSCRALTTIEGVLDFKRCTSYNNVFGSCPNLTSVKVKNLPTDIDTFCTKARIDKSKVIIVQ